MTRPNVAGRGNQRGHPALEAPGADRRPRAALLALRSRPGHQPAPHGANRGQRGLQPRRDRTRRNMCYLMARVEGADRKSFFAVAESDNGVDGFRFRDRPVVMPETPDPDVNVYDMRLVAHEDGHIYGLFCTERKDPDAPPRRPLVGGRPVRHRAHRGPRDLGAPGRSQDAVTAAAQRRPPPRVRRRQIRLLHPSPGRLHRGGVGRRHRLGPVGEHRGGGRSTRRSSSTTASTTPSPRPRTGSARHPSRPTRAGCSWRTGCAAPRRGCAMCSMPS